MIAQARQFLAGHWQLLALSALVIVFFRSAPVFPLRLLVVLFHELSHGAAALLTGGEILSIEVNAREGGLIWTRGGWRFAISSAGYLGSLAIGVVLLLAAVRTRADRLVLALCGAVILGAAVFWVRDWFSLAFCLGAGGAMLACARFAPREVSDLALRVIGLTSMAYVPWDIWSDTIARSTGMSDAAAIAARSFGTEGFWGGLWLVISVAVIGLALRYGLGARSNVTLSRNDTSR